MTRILDSMSSYLDTSRCGEDLRAWTAKRGPRSSNGPGHHPGRPGEGRRRHATDGGGGGGRGLRTLGVPGARDRGPVGENRGAALRAGARGRTVHAHERRGGRQVNEEQAMQVDTRDSWFVRSAGGGALPPNPLFPGGGPAD